MMDDNNSFQENIKLNKDDILCREGDDESDLYMINSGKLIVCATNGSQVSPIAYLGEGEYFGEMSFFDKNSRSANVICLEDCSLTKFSNENLNNFLPPWLLLMAKAITKKIRTSDELIATHGLRKKNVKHIAALSIEEQTHFYQLLKTK